jgi:hypothetical protein
MKICRRRVSVPLATAALSAFVAVPALAYVCHPDPAGTRTLAVKGHLTGYALRGSTVEVSVRSSTGCVGVTSWRPTVGPTLEKLDARSRPCSRSHASTAPPARSVIVPREPAAILTASDGARRAVLRAGRAIELFRSGKLVRRFQGTGSPGSLAMALSGTRLVVVVAGSVRPDRPPALEVYDAARGVLLRVWPLNVRPVTLGLYGGVALFAGAQNGGAYGLRLRDGLTTFFGPLARRDLPLIGRAGVVFQSGMYARLRRQGTTLLKFLPPSTVRTAFARTFHSLTTRQRIDDFTMDGQRVAVLLHGPAGRCQVVRMWSIAWHYFGRIDMERDVTCEAGMKINRISLSGIKIGWVATVRRATRVILTDADSCIERVLARAASPGAVSLAGDSGLLAYGGSVSRGPAREPGVIALGSGVRALSVDSRRMAVLRVDGRIELRGAHGRLIRTIAPIGARAIALRRERIVVLTRARTLEVWNTTSGSREHVWRVPTARSSRVDVQYDIAVFAAAGRVYALQLDSGRLALLARTPGAARVQIEEPGVVYQYNAKTRGQLRFIPLASVEDALA